MKYEVEHILNDITSISDTLYDKQSNIRSYIDDISCEADDIESYSSDIEDRIATLEEYIKDYEEEIELLKEENDGLKNKINEIEVNSKSSYLNDIGNYEWQFSLAEMYSWNPNSDYVKTTTCSFFNFTKFYCYIKDIIESNEKYLDEDNNIKISFTLKRKDINNED